MAGLSDLFGGTPYRAPATMDNPFTTPGDQQRQRISAALGWDTGNPWGELVRRLPQMALSPAVGRVAPRPVPVPQGPWSQPAPAAQPHRWGQADRPNFHWSDVPAGRLDRFDPTRLTDPRQLLELGKGAGAVAGAGGAAAGAGSFLTDTLAGVDPPQAAWNAVRWPHKTQPPSWWPGSRPQQAPPAPDPLESVRRGVRASIR